ncbi:putative inositol monophosphatase 3 [Diplonema papillatum]|nr:putative inositol monophosphatase 3 [Diplonema papillatum]|eukprot:gene7624-11677_t
MALTNLLRASEQACKDLAPMVQKLYTMINADTAKEKGDKSIFTVADGLVQHMITTELLAKAGLEVVGEEDAKVNLERPPFTVDDLTVPGEVEGDVKEAQARLRALGEKLAASAAELAGVTAFIDPIDGTREFSTGLGEQCSICVGFAKEGKAVAGVVFRPLTSPPTYASGCPTEGYTSGNTPAAAADSSPKLLTSNGSISKFLEAYLEKQPAARVKSGGAGNKVLMLLEHGAGCAYIQDRGLSRWDTCAAEAVIKARGGLLVKLSPFIRDGSLVPYTYLKSDVNTDFTPNEAKITPYNSTDPSLKGQLAADASQVKPYSNLAGIFAVNTTDEQTLTKYSELLREIAKSTPAAFD